MLNDTYQLAFELGQLLRSKALLSATAESCTGGGIASAITEVPGSSVWFDRGFVTYSNEAKCEMLQVSERTIQLFGAVSQETVIEMAKGAIQASRAKTSVAVSGIAGPDGGSKNKPIGTVWIAWGGSTDIIAQSYLFEGNRLQVRMQAIRTALAEWISFIRIKC